MGGKKARLGRNVYLKNRQQSFRGDIRTTVGVRWTQSGVVYHGQLEYLGKQTRSLRRHERRPSLTRTPPHQSWGRGPPPQGWRRIQARRSTCLLLRTVCSVDGSSPSCGLGGVSSSPVHRAFVLVLGTNIAVLLDCSKSSRQCSLSYLLTRQEGY
jgi:hypothetical protein